jgi:hypothetical protein
MYVRCDIGQRSIVSSQPVWLQSLGVNTDRCLVK